MRQQRQDHPVNPRPAGILSCFLASVCMVVLACPSGSPAAVLLQRLPHGGIQPQVHRDAEGFVHLIYFKGDPKGGDLFYSRRPPREPEFSPPIRVNHQSGSATAMGTIRGGQFALGRSNQIHVVWNGSTPLVQDDFHTFPLYYTHLNPARDAFIKERNLITYSKALDGGASVAADAHGHVWVVWHAAPPGNAKGEQGRAVYASLSKDDGDTFAEEKVVSPKPLGACSCCGLKAQATPEGQLFVLYRTARQPSQRDAVLMATPGPGRDFRILHSSPWTVFTCPMSSADLCATPFGMLAAWEQDQQIRTLLVPYRLEDEVLLSPLTPPGQGKRKHPVSALNSRGERLLAWTEDTGWGKGGQVAWQVFAPDGQATAERGRAQGVPAWGLVAAVTESNGDFLILY